MRFNVQTQQSEEFDPDPRIEYDETRGVYLISWVNTQGRRSKTIVDPPIKLDVIVQGDVMPSSDGKGFSYIYSLQNSKTSQQRLQSLYVETKANTNDVVSPDAGWYSRPLTDYLREVLTMPEGWAWADTKYDRLGVPPGGSARGLGFKSMGLPSVVACYVSGYWGGLKSLGGESGEGPAQLFDALKPITWKLPNGATVGPADPPRPFNPARFVHKLSEYVSASLKNGWIESPDISEQFKTSLAQIQDAIEKGDKPRAAKQLADLLARVEREKDKTLLSEAYALLKFNLGFLQHKLQGK